MDVLEVILDAWREVDCMQAGNAGQREAAAESSLFSQLSIHRTIQVNERGIIYTKNIPIPYI